MAGAHCLWPHKLRQSLALALKLAGSRVLWVLQASWGAVGGIAKTHPPGEDTWTREHALAAPGKAVLHVQYVPCSGQFQWYILICV